ncbi:MAG: hypothetical protein A2143_08060 [Gallionellales bacterium RBG_16_57_15]|nr:MAG: hypothetical protein A2143_08060 [Gallionellales bacterium RBG_16_57_15]
MNPAAPILKTQSEFADLIGVHKSHITRLKQHGRLVMVGAGKAARVDVVASKLRLTETEGGRDDVAARHAAAKGQEAPAAPSEKRVDAQTRKEAAQADVAEMERDVMRGGLIARDQVEQALADVVAFARQGIENLPHRVAAQLVNKDFDAIMAILKQEIVGLMGEMHRQAGRELAWLTNTEGA